MLRENNPKFYNQQKYLSEKMKKKLTLLQANKN